MQKHIPGFHAKKFPSVAEENFATFLEAHRKGDFATLAGVTTDGLYDTLKVHCTTVGSGLWWTVLSSFATCPLWTFASPVCRQALSCLSSCVESLCFQRWNGGCCVVVVATPDILTYDMLSVHFLTFNHLHCTVYRYCKLVH